MEAGTGTPIWSMVDSVTLTASLRDSPGGKFDEIVLATNSPLVIDRAQGRRGLVAADRDLGPLIPEGLPNWISATTFGRCHYSGTTSMTTWY
jgi:hypothetical protein